MWDVFRCWTDISKVDKSYLKSNTQAWESYLPYVVKVAREMDKFYFKNTHRIQLNVYPFNIRRGSGKEIETCDTYQLID